jgi:glycosyltransferase involved in cell wall biosynthesis
MIDISIIIPCYNSGQFITEAVESVKAYSGKYSYEIIIIDDGSTDLFTLEVLKELSKPYVVLRKENKGPATARNYGCRLAKGRYFLFLDSDNKIIPEYIDLGITSLDQNITSGVVYAKAHFFGDKSRIGFNSIPFDIKELLVTNYIDMCTIVRKEAWESVGGFDESPDMFTLEDWDFWLSIFEKGWNFYFLNKPLFYYRIREGSLMDIHLQNKDYFRRNIYLFDKHYELYRKYYAFIIDNAIAHFKKKSLAYRIGNTFTRPAKIIKKYLIKLFYH